MPGRIPALYFRGIKIVKIVDNGDIPITFGQQPVNQMRTNKSGAAGY